MQVSLLDVDVDAHVVLDAVFLNIATVSIMSLFMMH
jgi:hypothetical protein